MKNKTIMFVMAFLILSMPIAFAQQTEMPEAKNNKEYTLLGRAVDRIKLAFTLQIEKKLEMINRIQERRQQHYDFLIEKGKTEQAERFKAKTIGIVKNFDQWKANKQDIISKIGNKSAEVKGKAQNKIERMTTNASERKTEGLENKPAQTRSGY